MSVFNNQRQANIRVVFRKFDKDSDGFITVKDLISVFRELGEDVREDELREHFHNAGRGHGCEKKNFDKHDLLLRRKKMQM